MSIKLILKNSTVKDKAPVPADLDVGELAVNLNKDSPAIYGKDSAGAIVKLAGSGSVGDSWTRTGTTLSPSTAGDAASAASLIPTGATAPANGMYLPAANSVGIATASTERMRIDSSGKLLVGTSTTYAGTSGADVYQFQSVSPAAAAGLFKNTANSAAPTVLCLGKARNTSYGALSAGDSIGAFQFQGADGTNLIRAAEVRAQVDGTPGANDMPGRLVFSTTAAGANVPTEACRIDRTHTFYALGGQNISSFTWHSTARIKTLAIGTTTAGDVGLETTTNAVDVRYALAFSNPNGIVGSISTNGSATAFNTSSDYRLKENVVPLTGAVARLQQLKPSQFNFITDSSKTVDGFIAHEAQAVVPECVTGTKDEVDAEGNPVYQGIDQSKLVPLLTAALQEAIAKIETLEAKVTALEALSP